MRRRSGIEMGAAAAILVGTFLLGRNSVATPEVQASQSQVGVNRDNASLVLSSGRYPYEISRWGNDLLIVSTNKGLAIGLSSHRIALNNAVNDITDKGCQLKPDRTVVAYESTNGTQVATDMIVSPLNPFHPGCMPKGE